MGRTKSVSVHSRASEYKSHYFYVSDTNILICKPCNLRINWEKRDTSEKHIKTSGHIDRLKHFTEQDDKKRQATLPTTLHNQKKAKIEKHEFIEETVKMFLRANIPLRKIDDPAVREYINKYIPGSGDIPQASTLRKNYVPLVGDAMQDEIKQALQNKQIVIVADETTDSLGRCVFAVLFRTVSATAVQEVYLASCSFLNKANGTTCSQAILETLNKYSVSYDNVVGLVSDSARYMGTCFAALKTILGEKLIHFQCWAHKISLVGDCYLKEFQELNTLVAKMKMAFLHSRKIKNAYIAYLEDHHPELPAVLFPAPVLTRWNSWFTSVEYLAQYMEELVSFFSGCEFSNSSSAYIIDMFEDQHLSQKLKVQIKFVSETCGAMKVLITNLEGSAYPYAHKLWDELTTLQSSLQRYADGAFPQGTLKLLNEYSNMTKKEEVKSQIKSCMQRCLQTLANHMGATEANSFYQCVGALFNPATAGQKLLVDIQRAEQHKKRLPCMSGMNPDTFSEGYCYFHKQLSSHLREGCEVDIVQLLLAVKVKYPEFSEAALRSIWAPVSSVEAERFFSRYNLIVTDKRNRMTEQTVETCCMLSFNSFDDS